MTFEIDLRTIPVKVAGKILRETDVRFARTTLPTQRKLSFLVDFIG